MGISLLFLALVFVLWFLFAHCRTTYYYKLIRSGRLKIRCMFYEGEKKIFGKITHYDINSDRVNIIGDDKVVYNKNLEETYPE